MGLTGKEYHIKFVRRQSKLTGKYHTAVRLKRANAPAFKQEGILHRIDGLGRRFEGDKPTLSVTKRVSDMRPTTAFGKGTKYTLSAVNKVRKTGTRIVWKSALSAETVGLTFGNFAKTQLMQNLRYKADTTDSGKAVLSTATTLRNIDNARKTIVQHHLQKKKYKLHKKTAKSAKLIRSGAKVKFKGQKKNFKVAKSAQKKQLKAISNNFDKVKKTSVTKKVKTYKLIKRKRKLIKNDYKLNKKVYKNKKRSYKNRRKLKKLYKPKSLIRLAVGASVSGSVYRFSNRIAQEAADNDFVQAANKAVTYTRHAKTISKKRKNHKIAKTESRKEKLSKKSNKLQQRKNKLQKGKIKHKKKRKPPKSKTTDKVAKLAGKLFSFIFKFFGFIAAPLLIIIFFFSLILMVFGGGASKNSAILGTYYCNDYDMSRAIESYTNIAYEYNLNLIRCKSKNEWRQGLKNLKVNTDSMDDTPTKYYYGKNIIQNYEPVYDFDANKLIAFMCAYTYDFTDTEDKEQTWKYSDDKFDDILQDLFDKEYSFKYKYANGSYWQELSRYDAYPGDASDDFYYCKSSGSTTANNKTYGYIDFGSCGVPSALTSYHKSKKVYFNLSTGEILNVNKSYAKTGFYFQNLNKSVKSPDSSTILPFYTMVSKDGDSFLGFRSSGTSVFPKTQLVAGGKNFDWAMAADDVKTRFGDTGKQAVRFYKRDTYITDCTLYTNVQQIRSFDDAIYAVLNSKSQSLFSSQKKIKDDYAQRKQYYQVLACLEQDENGKTQTTYGLHQSFECNPLPGNFVNTKIYNNFGYDVVSWYNRHCQNTMHYGTDFSASKGTNVYSLMDGKVESIDTSNHTVVIITEKDRNIWYENDTARTFKLTYGNITLKSGLKKDSKVKLGEYIGKVDDYKHCDGNDTKANQNYLHLGVQIKYGLVWHDVDPQFLIYRENK